MTISISKEQEDVLKEMAKKENRSYSKQIIHMMQFYIENKDKIK